MTAIVRPDDWNLPLLLHVGGAMVLVGALVTVAAAFYIGARAGGPGQPAGMNRLAFRVLLLAALPSFILMRVAAQWIASEQNLDDSDAAWIGIGYITTDMGLLLLIAATVIAGIAARRAARGDGPSWASRTAPVLTLLLVAIYLVATWAMTAKPV
jgi:hypothetical protein